MSVSDTAAQAAIGAAALITGSPAAWWAFTSSTVTVRSPAALCAATATEVASASSFLRPCPVDSTRTRAASLAGTSTAAIPSADSRVARGHPARRHPRSPTRRRASGRRSGAGRGSPAGQPAPGSWPAAAARGLPRRRSTTPCADRHRSRSGLTRSSCLTPNLLEGHEPQVMGEGGIPTSGGADLSSATPRRRHRPGRKPSRSQPVTGDRYGASDPRRCLEDHGCRPDLPRGSEQVGMEARAGASPHVNVGCRAGAGPGR